jgi:uncharacterized protein (DUF4415 family)
MSKVFKRPSIAMPTSKEDKAITAAAKADPDAQPLTPRQLKAMVPLRALRGRPKSGSAKQLVSVRYSPEVLAYFPHGWCTARIRHSPFPQSARMRPNLALVRTVRPRRPAAQLIRSASK